ncbi:MAG TPA: hypothetical protein VKP30_29950 [Polyangiaceae bacterium]|nr:hypothetical protein [Polyangiaceae bacterium]
MSSRRANSLRFLSLTFVAAGWGCSHNDESPDVSTKGVAPDVVCNAQLTTPVAVTGSGFAPMATKTLEDGPVLVLPAVTLTGSQTLEGAKNTGEVIELAGEPGKKNASDLSWQSSQQMTVAISERLAIDPGIYDLLVTNPDGEKKAEINGALAVVPPPQLTAVDPKSLCDAQTEQTLVLTGSTFLKIDAAVPNVRVTSATGTTFDFAVASLEECSEIPGRSKATQQCRKASIKIPADTLTPGVYSVVLTNPAPAACASTEAVTFTVNPPPEVTQINPSTICTGGSTLAIAGRYFQSGASVELRCGTKPAVVAASVTFQTSESLLATFGAGIAPAEQCDVVVINPDTCSDEPLPHRTVTGTEGPIAFYSDPPVAYSALSTRLTVYLTSVSGQFTAALIAPDGTETPLSSAALVAGKTNRIQATAASGLAAGAYDIAVRDETGCRAVLADGLVLTDQLSITLSAVEPSFAQSGKSTAVTISRTGGTAFAPTPRVFLMPDVPQPGDSAIQLSGVKVLDEGTLTAVIPATARPGNYDLVVVNPTGTEVGSLDKAVNITVVAPPVIDNVVPQSFVAATGQLLEVRGRNFVGSTATLRCQSSVGAAPVSPAVASGVLTCANDNCTQNVTLDGSGVPAGSVCIVRITNSDGTYGDFSAVGVTNSSYNLNAPRAGLPMLQARRALGAAAVKATRASRFVYAIGGDSGAGTASRSDIESSEVDVFGTMRAWQHARAPLAVARANAATATLGRYIYVFGGTSDGTAALGSGERALVLSPEEVPEFADVDLCLEGGTADCFGLPGTGSGVAQGTVAYRVAAVIAPTDAQNLGGETLPSETLILKLPSIAGRNISVKLSFNPPADPTGTVLSGISGYRVYRTPLNGVAGRDEVLLGTIAGPNLRVFVDDGSAALGTETPLPLGSTSTWQALPALNVARAGLAGAVALDPANPSQAHLYALLGKSSAAANGGTVLNSYEHLAISLLANGRQTVAGAWAAGASAATTARWHAGAWTVDHDQASLVTTGNTWIYLGGGELANGNGIGTVEAALVNAGGELSAFSDTPGDFSSERSGYGTAAAAGRLFAFGGRAPNPKSNATAAEIVAPVPALSQNAWNNEGLNMSAERYLPGTAVQSAFIFLLGGESTGNAAINSTDLVVW